MKYNIDLISTYSQMKVLGKIATTLSVLLLCAACTNEDDVFKKEEISGKGLTATIPTYTFADGTRVNISDDLQTFTWSDGDQLGLYYQGSGSTAHAGFTILAGGGSTGTFVNEAFRLKSSSTYYAFYPFNENAIIAEAPVDFTGQVQNGNGSAAHLGGYNYMYTTVNTDNNGNASIQFKNLSSVMQLRLTVSNAATYTGIDIASDGAEFITKGSASMTDGSITETETSSSIHLDIEDGITLNADDVLTANILTAPVDLSSSTLTITVTDSEEKTYEVTTSGKNMLQGKAYLYAETLPNTGDIPYITFTADAEQTFHLNNLDVESFEYSLNGGEWAEYLSGNTIKFGGEKGNLRLRGKSSVGTNGSMIYFGNDTKVACSGDIRTLVDYENYSTVNTENATFKKLFLACSQLTQAPKLPAKKLAANCYYEMFVGCSSLTQAPDLPAINLSEDCYREMFYNCKSLTQAPTQAPELPATSLAQSCYQNMFSGCTSLTQAPKLAATTLADWCYNSMFSGCTSLAQAPELPATTLGKNCYTSMFQDCTSLTKAPELPATTLTYSCYNNMFQGCTSLTQAPELPATTLGLYCYSSMFQGCTSLTHAPELPATTLTSSCYTSMFKGCTSLTQAPELPATSLSHACYKGMFQSCTSLTQAPNLPATTLSQRCYSEMFQFCTSLSQAPELPATSLESYCYEYMFNGCTSLETAPELPASILTIYCYNYMFYGCTSLVTAPELPATTLANYSYYSMFSGCTNLNYIKMMATNISADNCLHYWVEGVSSTGTFIKNKDATWNVTGYDGIPSGWTVVTE